MSVLNLEAKLERVDPSTSWGFRMQGGKDFSSALTIQRVNPGSLAAKCGLQVGDIILKIGNIATDILRHKEAQDMIIASGDKLDLLLQRGAVPSQPTYEKFTTPSIYSLQNQPSPYSSQQNYNSAPKPFSSGGGSSGVDNLSGRLTQGLSISSPLDSQQATPPPSKPRYQASYDKYADLDDERDSRQVQGKSFKRLQGLIDSGEAPSTALRPIPKPAGSVTKVIGPSSEGSDKVKAVVNSQYNTPIGLYSGANVVTTFKGQAKVLTGEDINIPGETTEVSTPSKNNGADVDEFGKKKYMPSETYKLVKEQESPPGPEKEVQSQPTTSKTFARLEKSLQGGNPPAPTGQAPIGPGPQPPWAQNKPASSGGSWQPVTSAGVGFQSKPAARPSGGPGPMRGKKGDAVYQSPSQVNRQPMCSACQTPVRGPFVMAMGKTWCPDHFICANPQCGVKLIDIGFVEEGGFLYCERDYAQHFAPHCKKCSGPIIGECVNALNGEWHPGCFVCFECKKTIGGGSFHQEDGKPYCDDDWNRLFQTMCYGCDFPIEPGDRWVEAMSKNWHAECFNCQHCQVNLEGQPFFPKGGKPYCKKHMRP